MNKNSVNPAALQMYSTCLYPLLDETGHIMSLYIRILYSISVTVLDYYITNVTVLQWLLDKAWNVCNTLDFWSTEKVTSGQQRCYTMTSQHPPQHSNFHCAGYGPSSQFSSW